MRHLTRHDPNRAGREGGRQLETRSFAGREYPDLREGTFRGPLRGRTDVSERPEVVGSRSRTGDGEADLLISAVVTLVGWVKRFALFQPVGSTRASEAMQAVPAACRSWKVRHSRPHPIPNNARFLVLPGVHSPNLASETLSPCLRHGEPCRPRRGLAGNPRSRQSRRIRPRVPPPPEPLPKATRSGKDPTIFLPTTDPYAICTMRRHVSASEARWWNGVLTMDGMGACHQSL